MSYSAILTSLILGSMLIVVDSVQAASMFRPNKSINFESASSVEGNPSNKLNSADATTDMLNLARSASEGAGRLKTPGAFCYRSVKQIVADAFGKDLSCVRSVLSAGSAKDGGKDLMRVGFVNDMSKCNTPGTIRIYKGVRDRRYRATAGDIHGHSEVVGDEGMFHSFYSSTMSADDSNPRRILTGCYVPDHAKVSSSALGKCPNSSVSYKTKRAPSPKSKKGIE